MAESAAAAAPSSGPGGKSSSSGTWWKSLTSRKKPKEATAAAPRTPSNPSEPPFAPPDPSDSLENQPPNLGNGSRRNLKISRSGRFKEKRKARATLLAESPQQLFEGAGKGATPELPGEETPCP